MMMLMRVLVGLVVMGSFQLWAAALPSQYIDLKDEAEKAYANGSFARAREKPVLCLAHVTNQMAVSAGDFEKGEAAGAHASLQVIAAVARAWQRRR